MEPVPETAAAFNEMLRYGDAELATTVLSMGRRITLLVPECVGLSVSLVDEGVTFTLVATREALAGLDAVQYLDGGPCVDAVHEEKIIETQQPDLLDEDRWHLYAAASAAVGVASSLSMPVESDGVVIGGVNLYASTPNAFTGKHEEIARELGADAAGAITNADLGFRTRMAAAETPAKMADQHEVDLAVGILAASQGVHVTVAQERLQSAADRAGISLVSAARAVRFVQEP